MEPLTDQNLLDLRFAIILQIKNYWKNITIGWQSGIVERVAASQVPRTWVNVCVEFLCIFFFVLHKGFLGVLQFPPTFLNILVVGLYMLNCLLIWMCMCPFMLMCVCVHVVQSTMYSYLTPRCYGIDSGSNVTLTKITEEGWMNVSQCFVYCFLLSGFFSLIFNYIKLCKAKCVCSKSHMNEQVCNENTHVPI